MTLIQYKDFNFQKKTLAIIDQANEIITNYRAQGFTLTLRQLYYQFISRDLFPNNEKSYDMLGVVITNARLAGLISWTAIEDRGRGISPWLIEEDQQEVLKGIENAFALDYWERQGVYVEVWVEKDALSSVIERPCGRRRVPYMACKGYLSASEAWRAGRRFERALRNDRRCVLIHLGDHDPSGIDMTRDNGERLELFARQEVEVRRIALNMDQVRRYSPPPNPTKMTDSRSPDYVRQYGRTSWELDALEPSVIDALITAEIESLVDENIWTETAEEEERERQELASLYNNWPEVRSFIQDNEL